MHNRGRSAYRKASVKQARRREVAKKVPRWSTKQMVGAAVVVIGLLAVVFKR